MLKPRERNEALGISGSGRRVAISATDRAAVRTPVREWFSKDGTESILTTDVQDYWIEEALPGHAEWVIASRIIGDARGVPVIAEIRIFPNDDRKGAAAAT